MAPPSLDTTSFELSVRRVAATEVRGMRHGQGTMTWPEGSRTDFLPCKLLAKRPLPLRYTGMFERGRANGDGELIRRAFGLSGDACK